MGWPTEITTNLYAALSRLRCTETVRTLWIDAICINQKDIAEKSFQIELMRDIYSSAEEVSMWLGEPNLTPDEEYPKIRCSSQMITDMKAAWPDWVYPSLAAYLRGIPVR